MVSCSAFGCGNRSGKDNVSFHKFPKEPKLRALWIKAVNRRGWTPSSFARLCSDHFLPSDLNKTYHSNWTHLREHAIPKIFLPIPKQLQKSIHERKSSTKRPASTEPSDAGYRINCEERLQEGSNKNMCPKPVLPKRGRPPLGDTSQLILTIKVVHQKRRNGLLKKKRNTRQSSKNTLEVSISKNRDECLPETTLNTKKVHVPDFLNSLRHSEPRECAVCHRKMLCHEVCTFCPECKSSPPLCLQPCFRIYHCY